MHLRVQGVCGEVSLEVSLDVESVDSLLPVIVLRGA